jgi:hypothetical protein
MKKRSFMTMKQQQSYGREFSKMPKEYQDQISPYKKRKEEGKTSKKHQVQNRSLSRERNQA